MTRQELFAAMQAQGYSKVVAHFSGGHDEGGVDSVTAYRGDEEIDLGEAYNSSDSIVKYLVDAVGGRYGGFAGDFYVDGNVTADLLARTVEMSGSEEIPQDRPFNTSL